MGRVQKVLGGGHRLPLLKVTDVKCKLCHKREAEQYKQYCLRCLEHPIQDSLEDEKIGR